MFVGLARMVRRNWVPTATVAVLVGAVSPVGVSPAAAQETTVDCNADSSALQPAINTAPSGATLNVSGTCVGPVSIRRNLTLIGRDGVIDGNQAGRSTVTVGRAQVQLDRLTITNGRTSSLGGGIANFGTLTVSNCTVSNNTAVGAGSGHGGGIHNSGTLTVTNSTVYGNTTGGAGGGINNNGDLTVSHSTFYGNSADSGGAIFNYVGDTATVSHTTIRDNIATSEIHGGGGIGNFAGGTLTLSNSTLSQNTAPVGGGVENEGTAELTRVTVTGNTALNQGGGVYNTFGNDNGSGTMTLIRSNVVGNTAEGGPGSGGGIYNVGDTVTLDRSEVAANDPDNCAPTGSVPGCTG